MGSWRNIWNCQCVVCHVECVSCDILLELYLNFPDRYAVCTRSAWRAPLVQSPWLSVHNDADISGVMCPTHTSETVFPVLMCVVLCVFVMCVWCVMSSVFRVFLLSSMCFVCVVIMSCLCTSFVLGVFCYVCICDSRRKFPILLIETIVLSNTLNHMSGS